MGRETSKEIFEMVLGLGSDWSVADATVSRNEFRLFPGVESHGSRFLATESGLPTNPTLSHPQPQARRQPFTATPCGDTLPSMSHRRVSRDKITHPEARR